MISHLWLPFLSPISCDSFAIQFIALGLVPEQALASLGAMLMGVIVDGSFLALSHGTARGWRALG